MLKVVLADDEKKIILLLQKLIDWERLGYEIVGTANDGLRALELVKEQQPHLLITDIQMPGCGGIELIQRARELRPDMHFIIISGYQKFEYALNALKYGVEDYLLKPLKQDELTAILQRIGDKLGREAEVEFQLQKSREQQQELLIEALFDAAGHRQPFTACPDEAFAEVGGICFAALVKVDAEGALESPDGYHLWMQNALEIVRRELQLLNCRYAASVRKEGVAIALRMNTYRAVAVKQCFTKIQQEIQQKMPFRGGRCTVCLGSRQAALEGISLSMRQALWFCRDRLCHPHLWRDTETESITFEPRFQMDASQKKRMQAAAECLDGDGFAAEAEESFRSLFALSSLNGQMLEDWFFQSLDAALYGMKQSGQVSEQFGAQMEERFWLCADARGVLQLLSREVGQELRRLDSERAQREMRPITEAKRYIQQHYQEALRLEDVSNVVGFNATYFSTLFKKETGQNFMDYLTDLRISKAKELLCGDSLSVQDVAEVVGYRDLKYFSRLFKKSTGVSPSDYKKLYK